MMLWALNTDTLGLSHWDLPVTGVAEFGGITYLMTAAGILAVGGDTDDGDPIVPTIETGHLHFDSPLHYHRMVRAYVTGDTKQDVTVTTIHPEETLDERQYTISAWTDMSKRRAALARGPKGHYIGVRVQGVGDLRGLEADVETMVLRI